MNGGGGGNVLLGGAGDDHLLGGNAGDILIGGVGSIHGTIFGSIFMVVIMELLQWGVIPLSEYYPKLLFDFAYIKESAFGLAICVFLIFEPNGIAYRWWQIKNYLRMV